MLRSKNEIDRALFVFTLRMINDYWERNVPPTNHQIITDYGENSARKLFFFRNLLVEKGYISYRDMTLTAPGQRLIKRSERIYKDIFESVFIV